MPKRPSDMSQLDYLWLNFGGYTVENQPSEISSESVILTETAIQELISHVNDKSISILEYKEGTDSDILIGKASNGTELTSVKLPKEVHVTDASIRNVTQSDIDNGWNYPAGSKALSIVFNNSKELLLSLDLFDTKGSESNTIITEVDEGVISSHLKIDTGNNKVSVINLNTNSKGLSADIKLNENSDIELQKDKNGLSARIPLGTTGNYVKFEQMTLDQYQLLENKVPGTIYFMSDKPFLYLNNLKYGIDLKPGYAPVVAIEYDQEKMTLNYRTTDGTVLQSINMGPASETFSGVMSSKTYQELQNLRKELEAIENQCELSDEPDNLLTRDENNKLYCALTWVEAT